MDTRHTTSLIFPVSLNEQVGVKLFRIIAVVHGLLPCDSLRIFCLILRTLLIAAYSQV